MKRVKKIIFAFVIACFVICAFAFLQRLVMPKYQTGIVEGSMIEEYYDEKVPHEVVFIGDCEVYENISTVRLYEKYGVSSYIRGSAQQLAWQSYYLLEDTLRYETPKVVVFNVLSLKYDTPQSEAYNRMTLDGMRWSKSKAKAVNASMTEGEHFVEYVFPLLRYHSRIFELTEDDLAHLFSKDKVTHSGYYMRVDSKPEGEFPEPMPLRDYTLGENAMSYLDRMTELCRENGIELVLMKAPTKYPHWYDEWDRQIVEYAADNGLQYINFIDMRDEVGLDMSVDTYDAGLHLNLSGAEKMADFFGCWLTERFELTDFRQDERVSGIWKEKSDYYYEMKQKQTSELEQYGELVSFGANAVKD